jgi:hypothetical protein
MEFLKSTQAQNAVEWLVVAALLVAVLGGMLWSIFNSLADKLGEYNDAL